RQALCPAPGRFAAGHAPPCLDARSVVVSEGPVHGRMGRSSARSTAEEQSVSPLDPFLSRTRIAYFSMEIALRPEIHTYAGGLGVLAGDTVRSCADLELPAVFVTLASRNGYFLQEIDAQGRQVEKPDPWDVAGLTSEVPAMV